MKIACPPVTFTEVDTVKGLERNIPLGLELTINNIFRRTSPFNIALCSVVKNMLQLGNH